MWPTPGRTASRARGASAAIRSAVARIAGSSASPTTTRIGQPNSRRRAAAGGDSSCSGACSGSHSGSSNASRCIRPTNARTSGSTASGRASRAIDPGPQVDLDGRVEVAAVEGVDLGRPDRPEARPAARRTARRPARRGPARRRLRAGPGRPRRRSRRPWTRRRRGRARSRGARRGARGDRCDATRRRSAAAIRPNPRTSWRITRWRTARVAASSAHIRRSATPAWTSASGRPRALIVEGDPGGGAAAGRRGVSATSVITRQYASDGRGAYPCARHIPLDPAPDHACAA